MLNETLNLSNLSYIVLSPGLATLETRLSHMVRPLFLCTPYPKIKLLNFSCSAKACTKKYACLDTVVCIAIGRSPNSFWEKLFNCYLPILIGHSSIKYSFGKYISYQISPYTVYVINFMLCT